MNIESDETKCQFIQSFAQSCKSYCGNPPLHVNITFPEGPTDHTGRRSAESRIPALHRVFRDILLLRTTVKLKLMRFHGHGSPLSYQRKQSKQVLSLAINVDPNALHETDCSRSLGGLLS
ncbi:hypothetical protein C8J56DRAFT_1043540 [Mycena floridula]|nr:hypothetical protein C8J56DRAFT_1043540 [Mycena floridula]